MAMSTLLLHAALMLAITLDIGHGQCLRYPYTTSYENSCIGSIGYMECKWSLQCYEGYDCIKLSSSGRCGYCQAGFQYSKNTSGCEDIDECRDSPSPYSLSPCSGADQRCINTDGSYQCTCPSGYREDIFDDCIDIDECRGPLSLYSLSPCPGADQRCINTDGSYQCTCASGYREDDFGDCIDIDDCRSRPCGNGGSCTDLVNDFRCTCRPGFTGKICGADIDECQSQPCLNRGTCVDLVNDFRCICTKDSVGKTCAIDTPDLYINSSSPPSATGQLLRAMFSSEESYTGPDRTWTCTVEATDCSNVNVTVSVNITNKYIWLYEPTASYFSLPDVGRLGRNGDVFRQATYTTPFNVKLQRGQSSILLLAYITVRATSSLTMMCGRDASASAPTDACNHCQSSPCGGNVTCLNTRDDFLCLCPTGFINALDSHTCVARTADKVDLSASSGSASAIAGSITVIIIIATVVVIVVVVVLKRKRNAPEVKGRNNEPVSICVSNPSYEPERDLAIPPPPSRPPPTPRSTPGTARTHAELTSAKPEAPERDHYSYPYDLSMDQGPERPTAVRGAGQKDRQKNRPRDGKKTGKTSRPSNAGGDDGYSNLEEANRVKKVHDIYNSAMTYTNCDVVDGGSDAVKTHSVGHDYDNHDNVADVADLDQDGKQKGGRSCYENAGETNEDLDNDHIYEPCEDAENPNNSDVINNGNAAIKTQSVGCNYENNAHVADDANSSARPDRSAKPEGGEACYTNEDETGGDSDANHIYESYDDAMTPRQMRRHQRRM